jgi:hypothetical protein
MKKRHLHRETNFVAYSHIATQRPEANNKTTALELQENSDVSFVVRANMI